MSEKASHPAKSEFLEIVRSRDPLTVAVRGLQTVEEMLDLAISEALPAPHAVEISQLGFALKVDLGVALRVIPAELRPLFLKVNRIRNRFAHDRQAAFGATEAADLYNLWSPLVRQILGEEPQSAYTDPVDVLRESLAASFVMLRVRVTALRDEKAMLKITHEIAQETLSGRSRGTGRLSVHEEADERLRAERARREAQGEL